MQPWRSLLLAIVLSSIIPTKLVLSQAERSPDDGFSCPEDLQPLTRLLLKDLPDYSNRVINRIQRSNRNGGRNFIITASQAEFEPLNLPRIQYESIDEQDPEQVFFTVLQRQYKNNQVINLQTYHWLFLTRTKYGWRTVMMFSRLGNSKATKPPAPPRESTNGIIGQGIQLWLKDCRAGTIRR